MRPILQQPPSLILSLSKDEAWLRVCAVAHMRAVLTGALC